MDFKKATKAQAKARIALIGVSGSGKTYSALAIAQALGNKIAVIDTERGSASKYADRFEFDTLELETFSPLTYVEAIKAAAKAGYDVLVIDSLSHAWSGKEGALEQVDRAAKRSQSGNSFAAWRDVTPMHNALVDAVLQSPMHLIATMRAKTEYVLETNERGKQTPRKVGLAPVQRDGVEYEFDIVGDIDLDHNLIITKTRCAALDAQVVNKPGEAFGEIVKAWLTDGVKLVQPEQPARKHWAYDQAQYKKFTDVAASLKMDKEQILSALNVEKSTEFAGTCNDAIEKMKEWRDAHPALDVGFTGKGVNIPSAQPA